MQLTKTDFQIIAQIAKRAEALAWRYGDGIDRISVIIPQPEPAP